MLKKLVILILVLSIVTAGFIGCNKFFSKSPYQRVVFITIDTLRADHLSSYGYPIKTTPFFDSLVETGVMFDRALSVSSHTAPSHATMFTGIFPYQHRVLANHDRLPAELPNLYKSLSAAGFETVAFPSVRFLEEKVSFPLLDPNIDLPGSEINQQDWFRSAEVQIDRAIHWLTNREKSKPFFAWLHFYDVHPWHKKSHGRVPSEYFSQMYPEDIEKHADFLLKEHGIPNDWYKSREHMVKAISRYDARLKYVDDQIKRLAEFMDSQGIWKDTLVIITSDHGEGLGNHNYEGHGMHLYDEQLWVPLLFSVPNGKIKQHKVSKQVRTVDYFPTILDLLKVPLPPAVVPYQGVSLAEVIYGNKEAEQFLQEFSFGERRPKDDARIRRKWKDGEYHSLQNENWKLIAHSEGEHELYNLKEDRLELNNLFGKHPEIFERYKSIIETLLKLPKAGSVEPEELDASQIEELRSLGYL